MLRTRLMGKGSRLLASACAIVMLPAMLAAADDEPALRTGLFGVTSDQAVRISVLNTGDAKGTITPLVSILDVSGTLLAERRGRPLAEGVGSFADFGPAREGAPWPGATVPGAGTPRAVRAQVRAEVLIEYLPVSDDGRPIADDAAAVRALRRNVRLTLEVFDISTGRTMFTMPFEAVGFDPQPDPPAPARQ